MTLEQLSRTTNRIDRRNQPTALPNLAFGVRVLGSDLLDSVVVALRVKPRSLVELARAVQAIIAVVL